MQHLRNYETTKPVQKNDKSFFNLCSRYNESFYLYLRFQTSKRKLN